MILAVCLPYIVHSCLFHCIWHQVDGHGRVRLFALIGARETGDTIVESCHPFRFAGGVASKIWSWLSTMNCNALAVRAVSILPKASSNMAKWIVSEGRGWLRR